jgi:hypothetical protein
LAAPIAFAAGERPLGLQRNGVKRIVESRPPNE